MTIGVTTAMGYGTSTIDQTLARGLRRQEAREFQSRVFRLHFAGLPKRFGASARETHKRLVESAGAHRIRRVGEDKKSHRWWLVATNTRGNEELVMLTLQRTSRGPRRNLVPFGIEATPHFVERLIQAKRSDLPPTVDLMSLTLSKILTLATFSHEESAISWALSGNLTVALPDCLVLGYMPKRGNVELRTVLRVDVLDPDKRHVWERLSGSDASYAVRPINKS